VTRDRLLSFAVVVVFSLLGFSFFLVAERVILQ